MRRLARHTVYVGHCELSTRPVRLEVNWEASPSKTGGWAAMKEFPPFRLDSVNQCLWRHTQAESGERILLTPTTFSILRYLVEHAGRLVTHDELLDAVWPNAHVEPQAVKRHMLDVRSALGDDPKNPVFIETVPRRGYQFIAPVSEGRLPDSHMPATRGQGNLPGRSREVGELPECLRRSSAGRRQIVFVTGEPGIGKTADR